MQHHYPGEKRFSHKRFGSNPASLILSAYSEAMDQDLEQTSANSEAIARLADIYLQTKGIKDNDSFQLNPSKDLLAVREAKGWMPKAAAKTFLKLSKDNKVPEWALALLEDDVRKIRMAAL